MGTLTRIQGYAHIAARYGLEEAIFLDAIIHWYRVNRDNQHNYYDGRWWTYNSVKSFDSTFPWWSGKQLRRIIASCKEQGALLIGNYNKDKRDRTVWYSPSDELLELYGDEGKCNCPNGQLRGPERASYSAQTGEPLPCNTHVYNTPHKPPRGGAGLPAEARDKLERYVSGNPALAAAMTQYLDTRRVNKKAVKTAATVDLMLRKLDQLSGGDDQAKIAILEQSVERSWTGLFALDAGQRGRADQREPPRRVVEDEEVEWR